MSTGLLPEKVITAQAESGLELHLPLPGGWQGLKYLGHCLMLSRSISRQLDQKWNKQDTELEPVLTWDASVPGGSLTHCTTTPIPLLITLESKFHQEFWSPRLLKPSQLPCGELGLEARTSAPGALDLSCDPQRQSQSPEACEDRVRHQQGACVPGPGWHYRSQFLGVPRKHPLPSLPASYLGQNLG